MKYLIAATAALALALPAAAQEAPEGAPSPNEIVAGAPQSEWVAIAPDDLLVMTLAPDRDPGSPSGAGGNARQVVIQLMPPPFSQGWVENIRTLARAGWYDGTSINRVQDNYVVQWGDPDGEDAGRAKPLPGGLRVMGADGYHVTGDVLADADSEIVEIDLTDAESTTPREAEIAAAFNNANSVFADPEASESDHDQAILAILKASGLTPSSGMSRSEELAMLSINATQTNRAPEGWHQRDSYAPWVEIWRGWPLANGGRDVWTDIDGKTLPAPTVPRHEAYGLGYFHEVQDNTFWPVHCYGMVGVGRGYPPDTGSGAELYTVIGHAPRHLDRNIALVGRVIEGIEHLSSLPRGTGDLGFYETAEERVTIESIRTGTEAGVAPFEYLSTESATFARYAEARANRRDPFFIVPAGGADICNIPVPVRRVEVPAQ